MEVWSMAFGLPIHYILEMNDSLWRNSVLSGLRKTRARRLYLVTLMTVLNAMRRKRRRASHRKKLVYPKVI